MSGPFRAPSGRSYRAVLLLAFLLGVVACLVFLLAVDVIELRQLNPKRWEF